MRFAISIFTSCQPQHPGEAYLGTVTCIFKSVAGIFMSLTMIYLFFVRVPDSQINQPLFINAARASQVSGRRRKCMIWEHGPAHCDSMETFTLF